jgi:hypothetical protein
MAAPCNYQILSCRAANELTQCNDRLLTNIVRWPEGNTYKLTMVSREREHSGARTSGSHPASRILASCSSGRVKQSSCAKPRKLNDRNQTQFVAVLESGAYATRQLHRRCAEADLIETAPASGEHNPTADLGIVVVPKDASQLATLQETMGRLSPARRSELYALMRVRHSQIAAEKWNREDVCRQLFPLGEALHDDNAGPIKTRRHATAAGSALWRCLRSQRPE